MSNRFKTPLLASLMALLLMLSTSCSQVLMRINLKEVESDETPEIHISDAFINPDFWWLLAVCFIAGIFMWLQGYRVLTWFKRQHTVHRILVIMALLALLFTLGNLLHPQEWYKEEPGYYDGWFAIPVSCAILSLIMVGHAILKRLFMANQQPLSLSFRHQRNMVLLAKLMFCVFSCGWVLYFMAVGLPKLPHVGIEVLLRSGVYSLKLFLLDIDTDIINDISGYPFLKSLIVCTCLAAGFCILSLIFGLTLSRLMAYLHIRHLHIDSNHNHLYIFFGINDGSKTLADDIYKEDPQGVIIFVENSLVGEKEQDEDKTDGWKNILNLFTHRRQTFFEVREDDRRALAIASCSVGSLDYEPTDVWSKVGLNSVKRLIDKKLMGLADAQLHVFLLSEERDENVHAAANLLKDNTLTNKSLPTFIYCNARRNGVNRILEDKALKEQSNIELHLLDSSQLALELLRYDHTHHPVNLVKLSPDNPGAVSSPFVSLVVGFGETGRQAVRFLYEYGTFVAADATAQHSHRSPFECHVVDKDMPTLEGRFRASMPSVCFNNSSDNPAHIHLHHMDFRDLAFYEKVLAPIVDRLNYVIVAVHDDELNMNVAVSILRYVRRHRSDLSNFRIYVRAYEKGPFKHLETIANSYNVRLSIDGHTSQNVIIPFGQNQQIYKYHLIVNDKYLDEGKIYYETYRSLSIDPKNDEGTWEERRRKILNPEQSKTSLWERLDKLRRKEGQDRSNAQHAATKLAIMRQVCGSEECLQALAEQVLEGTAGQRDTIHHPAVIDPKLKRLILNMAMLEHMRWMAAHELLGYTNSQAHYCNDRTRSHNTLKPWQNLSDESAAASREYGIHIDYQRFDYGVIETTLKLYIEQQEKQNPMS